MRRLLTVIVFLASVAGLQGGPAFPLQVSENRRYLVDQRGVPFLYQADTPWMLFAKLTEAEAKEYITRRQEQGFTALQLQLTGFLGMTNLAGELPFAGTPPEQDFAKPNEGFFMPVDRVVAEAQRQGMLLAIAPTWSGCCGEGWAGRAKDGAPKPLNANGVEKSRELGRWLGRRYGKSDNVMWILGGDNDPDNARAEIRALGLGLKDTAPRQLITYHAASTHSSTDVWPADERWLDIAMVYSYFRGFNKAWNKNQPDIYEVSHAEFAKIPVRPFFLGESTYEGEHGAWGSAVQARKQAYWCLLGGGFGHAYGSPNWNFPANWRDVLELPGANSFKHLRRLLESRPWWKLKPDVNDIVAVQGRGTSATNDCAVTALADDGSFALSYLPSKRSITLDLTKVAGDRVVASWFNPRTGESTRIGEFTDKSPHAFEPAGDGDWVLALDDAVGMPRLSLAAPAAFATNRAPTVRVIAPKPTDDLRAPANFICTAEASDPDGRVMKVEFYAWSHALRLGTATNAPYTVTARPVFTVARMSIIARAYDDQGAATDSEPVWITVTDDEVYPPRAKPREERFISRHIDGSGHEGVPSLVELPNGDLLCAFYSGRYELSFDSSVYLTRLVRGANEWETSRLIIGGDNVPKANPVLMLGADGVLWCFYANIENGQEFEYSRPCYRQSHDRGATWGAEVRMPEPKFAHRTGTIFALKPIRLNDGTIVLPANRESDNPDQKHGWTSLFYQSSDAGASWTETPEIVSTPGNIQPTIQELSGGSLLGFFRPRGRNSKLWRSTSHDGGTTWAALERTTLDNPSTRSDFVLLPSGRLVLACNLSPVNRTPVNLLLSEDLGKTWRVNRAIETGPGPYGYCAVLRTHDGRIHIAYDTDRRVIKHAVVDEAWFEEPAVLVAYQRP